MITWGDWSGQIRFVEGEHEEDGGTAARMRKEDSKLVSPVRALT